MRKSILFCILLAIATALLIPDLVSAQEKVRPGYTVSLDRFGPVRVGMTLAQAGAALGVPVTRDEGYDDNECYYASPKRRFTAIAFMMNGRRIARIDVNGKEYVTDRGGKIGDSEARIKRLYKGKYKIYQHSYVDKGHYIEIGSSDGKYSIIFETDGKRVVTYRVGRPEYVGYVEGCS